MKKVLFPVLVLVTMLGTQGCIESHILMKLRSDGSGTIIERTVMSSVMVEQLEKIASSFKTTDDGESEPVEEEKPFITEEELRENASSFGRGVEYERMELVDDDGKRGYEAVYTFRDVNLVGMEDDPDMDLDLGMEDAGSAEQTETPAYSFTYTRGNPSTLIVHINQDEQDEDAQQDDDEIEVEMEEEEEDDSMEGFEEIKEMFRDMRIVRQIEFVDGIEETDADYVDDDTVTLVSLDFGELIDDEELLQQLSRMEETGSEEEVRELLKSIPGLQIEMKEQVTVRF